MITFEELWKNHPNKIDRAPVYPCTDSKGVYPPGLENQCAIRMGVCLAKSGMDLSGYPGARCSEHFPGLKHKPGHILRAEELAAWLKSKLGPTRLSVFKGPDVYVQAKKVMMNKTGIVFFKDAWAGGVDHIDLWNRTRAISRYEDDYPRSKQIWFWKIL